MVRLVALGDSITFGFPYLPDQSWVAHLAREIDGVVNKGVCGDTTADMLLRFERDVVCLHPAYVIICGGANDAIIGTPAREAAENIRLMRCQADAGGIVPLIALPAPCNLAGAERRLQVLRDWLREHVPPDKLIDFYTPLKDPSGVGFAAGLTEDGVHPNLAGYAAMAEAARQVLRGLIAGG